MATVTDYVTAVGLWKRGYRMQKRTRSALYYVSVSVFALPKYVRIIWYN